MIEIPFGVKKWYTGHEQSWAVMTDMVRQMKLPPAASGRFGINAEFQKSHWVCLQSRTDLETFQHLYFLIISPLRGSVIPGAVNCELPKVITENLVNRGKSHQLRQLSSIGDVWPNLCVNQSISSHFFRISDRRCRILRMNLYRNRSGIFEDGNWNHCSRKYYLERKQWMTAEGPKQWPFWKSKHIHRLKSWVGECFFECRWFASVRFETGLRLLGNEKEVLHQGGWVVRAE
jgi:hypothetical protein